MACPRGCAVALGWKIEGEEVEKEPEPRLHQGALGTSDPRVGGYLEDQPYFGSIYGLYREPQYSSRDSGKSNPN